jgi:hypothetical protein
MSMFCQALEGTLDAPCIFFRYCLDSPMLSRLSNHPHMIDLGGHDSTSNGAKNASLRYPCGPSRIIDAASCDSRSSLSLKLAVVPDV